MAVPCAGVIDGNWFNDVPTPSTDTLCIQCLAPVNPRDAFEDYEGVGPICRECAKHNAFTIVINRGGIRRFGDCNDSR